MRNCLILAFIFLSLPRVTRSEEIEFALQSCWRVDSTNQLRRWVIVRSYDLESKLYHIEVLERKRHSKPGEFKRLSPHIAITQSALERSLQQLLPSDLVYPESFNSAYAAWKSKSAAQREVCSTEVIDCLGMKDISAH